MSDISSFCHRWHRNLLENHSGSLDYTAGRLPGLMEEHLETLLIGSTTPQEALSNLLRKRIVFPYWKWEDQWQVTRIKGRWYGREGFTEKTYSWPEGVTEGLPFGVTPSTVDVLLEGRMVVIVEGEFDALSLWVCGIPGVAAGRSSLSVESCRALSEFIDVALILSDNDSAGERGALTLSGNLRRCGVEARIAGEVWRRVKVKDLNKLHSLYGVARVQQVVSTALETAL